MTAIVQIANHCSRTNSLLAIIAYLKDIFFVNGRQIDDHTDERQSIRLTTRYFFSRQINGEDKNNKHMCCPSMIKHKQIVKRKIR